MNQSMHHQRHHYPGCWQGLAELPQVRATARSQPVAGHRKKLKKHSLTLQRPRVLRGYGH
jgi:hypothetical protein